MSEIERPRGAPPEDAMISCEEALARVYEYLDGELDADWGERVRAHLEVCRDCYPHFDFERIFLDHIRSLPIPSERSERLAARIRDALAQLD